MKIFWASSLFGGLKDFHFDDFSVGAHLYSYRLSTSGYSLCPDLLNAATVSVSLIEGIMRGRQPNSGENGLEAARFRNITIFWQDRLPRQFYRSWHCRHHIFWLYDRRNLRYQSFSLFLVKKLLITEYFKQFSEKSITCCFKTLFTQNNIE